MMINLVYPFLYLLVLLINGLSFASIETEVPNFIFVAFVTGTVVNATCIWNFIRKALCYGFCASLTLAITFMLLFPLAVGKLYLLSDSVIVTTLYTILRWVIVAINILLGAPATIVYYLTEFILSAVSLSSGIAGGIAIVATAIGALFEGWNIGELLSTKLGFPSDSVNYDGSVDSSAPDNDFTD